MNDIKRAIEDLKHFRETGEIISDADLDYGLKKAIQALEKQIPKKPIETYELGYICPNCKGGMIYSPNITDNKHEDCNYCNECDQKLDWSEIENE